MQCQIKNKLSEMNAKVVYRLQHFHIYSIKYPKWLLHSVLWHVFPKTRKNESINENINISINRNKKIIGMPLLFIASKDTSRASNMSIGA